VADGPVDLTRLGRLMDEGGGVVCAFQAADGLPSAGGDDIYWWRDKPPPHLGLSHPGGRVRLMPLLAGLPTRVHGLITADDVIAFPPMEVIALPRRDRGTFLCAGTAPTLGEHPELRAVTERAGDALRNILGYRGAFSIDGILTSHGFRPTDLNARLTSAMEAAPPALRVRLHLANMLAREGAALDPNALRTLAQDTFARPERYTLYGAASKANGTPCTVLVRWHGQRLLVAYDDHVHGRLAITRSLRGWLLTATLHSRYVPTTGALNTIAPQVFELSDTALGTDFGALTTT
jgi:hypothetical protein